MFLRVPVKCRQTVIDALEAAGFKQEAEAVAGFTKDYVDPEANAYRVQCLERARAELGRDGEIEFDDDSVPSHSDDPGEYMLAWVWLYTDEKREEDEEE